MQVAIIPERLERVKAMTLQQGSHGPPNGHAAFCVMEAVAYVAGEPHTDSPVCVCPVIASFLRAWNDGLPDEDRTRLLSPLIPELPNTRSTETVQDRRAWMILDWLVRECTPAFLDVAKLTDEADALRSVAEIDGVERCEAAMRAIIAARDASAAAWDAAWDAAMDAAWAAARDAASAAAWDAARDAARAAAWAAARDAVWDAARAAARDAANAAAWAAARDATWDATSAALRPVVETLQESAIRLVRRMISVGG